MTIIVNWEAIAALGITGTALAGAFLWAVRNVVRGEIWKLNGYYIRAEKSTLTGAEIERRLDHLETVKASNRA